MAKAKNTRPGSERSTRRQRIAETLPSPPEAEPRPTLEEAEGHPVQSGPTRLSHLIAENPDLAAALARRERDRHELLPQVARVLAELRARNSYPTLAAKELVVTEVNEVLRKSGVWLACRGHEKMSLLAVNKTTVRGDFTFTHLFPSGTCDRYFAAEQADPDRLPELEIIPWQNARAQPPTTAGREHGATPFEPASGRILVGKHQGTEVRFDPSEYINLSENRLPFELFAPLFHPARPFEPNVPVQAVGVAFLPDGSHSFVDLGCPQLMWAIPSTLQPRLERDMDVLVLTTHTLFSNSQDPSDLQLRRASILRCLTAELANEALAAHEADPAVVLKRLSASAMHNLVDRIHVYRREQHASSDSPQSAASADVQPEEPSVATALDGATLPAMPRAEEPHQQSVRVPTIPARALALERAVIAVAEILEQEVASVARTVARDPLTEQLLAAQGRLAHVLELLQPPASPALIDKVQEALSSFEGQDFGSLAANRTFVAIANRVARKVAQKFECDTCRTEVGKSVPSSLVVNTAPGMDHGAFFYRHAGSPGKFTNHGGHPGTPPLRLIPPRLS